MPVGGSRAGVRGFLSSIPEPVGNPFRWYPVHDGVGTTVTERIADDHGTMVGGIDWITGTYIGDWAAEGDGNDGAIETTPWGDFGSNMASDFTVAISLSTTEPDRFSRVIRADHSADSTIFNLSLNTSSTDDGRLFFGLDDADGNNISIETDTGGLNDGTLRRIVYRKQTGNTPSDLEVWINGSQVSVSQWNDTGFSNPSDLDVNVPFLCRNGGGTLDGFIPGVVDDVTVWKSAISDQNISDDYNRMPWA